MDILGVFSSRNISPIQSVSYGDRSATPVIANRSGGDSISISNEAMEMYMASKNRTEEEKEIEKTMSDWFSAVYSGFGGPKTDYSTWPEENLELKKNLESQMDELLAAAEAMPGYSHLKPLPPEILPKYEEIHDKLSVLGALGGKMVVTDDVMGKGVAAFNKLKADWNKAHPEKSMLRSAIDGWQDIDPEKLEEEIKKKQDEVLAGSTEKEKEGSQDKTL